MELNNKEKYIKKVLENQDTPVDTSDLWAVIEDRVPFKDQTSRRRVWWFLLPFVLGVSLVSFIWYLQTNGTGELVTAETSLEQIVTQVDEDLTTVKIQSNESKNLSTTSQSDDSQSNVNNKDTQVNTTTQVAKSQPSKFQGKTVDSKTNQIKNTSKFTTQAIVETSQLTQVLALGQLSDRTPNNSNVVISQDKTEKNHLGSSHKSILQPWSLDRLHPSVSILSKLLVLDFAEPTMETVPLLSPRAKYYLIGSVGANLISSKITMEPQSPSLLQNLKREEQLLGYQASIGLQRLTAKGWYIKGLATHLTHATRYTTNEAISVSNTAQAVTEIYTDANGEVIPVNGAAKSISEINQDIRWHRVHRQLSLDLAIGKNFRLGPRLDFRAEVGLTQTIHQQHTGYYLSDSDQSFTLLDNSISNPYRQGYQIGGTTTLGINYKISDRLFMGLGGTAALPSNLMSESSPFQIKNSQLRFDFLVGYKLN